MLNNNSGPVFLKTVPAWVHHFSSLGDINALYLQIMKVNRVAFIARRISRQQYRIEKIKIKMKGMICS